VQGINRSVAGKFPRADACDLVRTGGAIGGAAAPAAVVDSAAGPAGITGTGGDTIGHLGAEIAETIVIIGQAIRAPGAVVIGGADAVEAALDHPLEAPFVVFNTSGVAFRS